MAFRTKLPSHIQVALSLARAFGLAVVHVMTRYGRDRADWPKVWRHLDSIWCLEGTPGVQILEQARPLAGAPVVVKTRFSGFYASRLDAVLRDLGVDALFLLADCVHAEKEETKASVDCFCWLTNPQVISTDDWEVMLCQEHGV